MGADKFSRLTPGRLPGGGSEAPAVQDVAQQGVVIAIAAEGVLFEIPDLPGQELGPAPWPIGPYASAALALAGGFAPDPGDRVLVVFAGAGIDTPWVLGWTR